MPELPVTEVTDDALLSFNRPDVRAVGVPGGGGVATAATVALFYQALPRIPTGSGTRTSSPTPPAGCATRSPTRLALGAPARYDRHRPFGPAVATPPPFVI